MSPARSHTRAARRAKKKTRTNKLRRAGLSATPPRRHGPGLRNLASVWPGDGA